MPSFTHSKDMIGAKKKFKTGSRGPDNAPFRGGLHFTLPLGVTAVEFTKIFGITKLESQC